MAKGKHKERANNRLAELDSQIITDLKAERDELLCEVDKARLKAQAAERNLNARALVEAARMSEKTIADVRAEADEKLKEGELDRFNLAVAMAAIFHGFDYFPRSWNALDGRGFDLLVPSNLLDEFFDAAVSMGDSNRFTRRNSAKYIGKATRESIRQYARPSTPDDQKVDDPDKAVMSEKVVARHKKMKDAVRRSALDYFGQGAQL